MDKIIIVIRDPLKAAVAEFSRQNFGKKKSFPDIDSFLKKGRQHFNGVFVKQLEGLMNMVTQHANNMKRKPVLFISYEDMKYNLLPQLFRIAHFLNMSDNPQVIERALCTILGQNKAQNAFFESK